MVTTACSSSPFCVGMYKWTDCYASDEHSTHVEVSALSDKERNLETTAHVNTCRSRATPTDKHFSEFIGDKELIEFNKGLIPANTSRCTKWAVKTFESWRNARNQRFPDDTVPEDLFLSTNPSLLNAHLVHFAVEARKASGEYYPPSSLHQLLCGILLHMSEINPQCPNFIDKKGARFRQLHQSLDVQVHSS